MVFALFVVCNPFSSKMPEKSESMSTPASKRPKWEPPETLVILFALAILATVASYFIPAGYFAQSGLADSGDLQVEDFRLPSVEDGEGGTYRRVSLFVAEADGGDYTIKRFPSDAESDIGLMNFAFEGLASGSKYGAAIGVVVFILIIGGAFGIIQATGAIELGILRVIELMHDKDYYCIPVLFLLFSLGGALFGMGVEAIAFAVILVPLFIAMGYDSITAVMTTYVATQIGFATSWMNPFSVAIAQGIAGVPVLSGSGFRVVMWLVFTCFGIIFTLRHALRVKKDPACSPCRESDLAHHHSKANALPSSGTLQLGHKAVLLLFFSGICWVTYGVIRHAYYIPEIASQFFILGVVCGIAAVAFRLPGMSLNTVARAFQDGASGMMAAALIVGFAKGLVLLMGGSDPHSPSMLNTILYFFASILGQLPGGLSAWSMYVFQSVFNLFITSGSGQAALTMPLMAPLADLVGLTRQLAVLAFQLGDGLTNLIVPTSAALMGTLAVAKIDWLTWLRFQIKFQAFLVALASGFLLYAYATGF
jgi:uncharacterized ion transporter superfamily protein YfcC